MVELDVVEELEAGQILVVVEVSVQALDLVHQFVLLLLKSEA